MAHDQFNKYNQPQTVMQTMFVDPNAQVQYKQQPLNPSDQNAADEEWKLVASKKRAYTSPLKQLRALKQTRISNYWLNAPATATTSNRYEELEVEDEEDRSKKLVNKEPKPPPIYVDGVNNISPLTNLLNIKAKDEYVIKIINKEQLKIQVKSSEKYSVIVKELQQRNTNFHTYKPKEERNFRVVLKNIHPTVNTEDLKNEIASHGHEVTNIFNIKKRGTNEPMPLFFIEIKPQTNNKDIYEIKTLLNCVIKFEPPHKKRETPQCAKCQRYGHTKAYCYHPARCVKCIGNHLTVNCQRKERSKDVECVLCNGNHPANYKGCTVYKQLQKATFPPLRKKQTTTTTHGSNPETSMYQPGISYAQKAMVVPHFEHPSRNHQPNNYQQPPNSTTLQTNDILELKDMIKNLVEKMDSMLNILTALVAKIA